ncbi:MAG: methyltransferase domain-containing protein [Actinobacteria bacterium]|nr:methyltransferase domain-containing protein [Actinomycetota bacterium]
MFQDQIHDLVRTAYRRIPSGAGRAMAARLYTEDELALVPEAAVDWSLGVGNPVRHAGLARGEVVVDLGCGGGIDTVLAARQVGPTGRVVGVDMLETMCERTRAAVEEAGVADRCEVVQGEMEDLPLPDGCADVVVSNGVVNLSPRKSRALTEAARVLRPGGRFCVSDLTVDQELPPEVLSSGAAWAGCVAGALSEDVFRRKLARSGLEDVQMAQRIPFSLDDVALYPLFTTEVLELMRRLLPEDARDEIATSLIVHARRRRD